MGHSVLSWPGTRPGIAVRLQLAQPVAPPRPLSRQRARLWELNPTVHCSVIGTCLTTTELRRTMARVLGRDLATETDHDLHSQAVGLCSKHDAAAKALHKALDRRHEAVINRFARLRGEAAILAEWAEARRAGDIPGAYWAVLTHPDSSSEVPRRAFGDVHMLSHLVGAANRADIRRLTALEEENAALTEKVERQQHRLHEAITSRDATIRRLSALAMERTTDRQETAAADADEALAGLRELAAELQLRLGTETARRERLERRLVEAAETSRAAQRRAEAAEVEALQLRRELTLLEAAGSIEAPLALQPQRVLYVGGRPGSAEQARDRLAAAGGALLVHDGGRHDHPSLLPGLIGQADRVMFPVDCVSHDAALTVKRLCRQLGKPFVPLRSSGLGCLLAALADVEMRHSCPAC